MMEFDPNTEPETQEQADAYINWCADQFMRLSQSERRTYRTAVRCAHWLFVVATAQLHLDDDVTENRDALLEQLAMYQQLGRALERQRDRLPVERLIVLRSSLDCWEPRGQFAGLLLNAARCAVSVLLLIDLYPLVDLWELPAFDAWCLLDDGSYQLATINEMSDELSFADYGIRPNDAVIAKFTWQRANNIVRHVGVPRLSEN